MTDTLRVDWSNLCAFIEQRVKTGKRTRLVDAPADLRYLILEPIRACLFYMLDSAQERVLDGRSKGALVYLRNGFLRLGRHWRHRLAAAGCDPAYPFSRIGDDGEVWK
jgi:hypothetical protein